MGVEPLDIASSITYLRRRDLTLARGCARSGTSVRLLGSPPMIRFHFS